MTEREEIIEALEKRLRRQNRRWLVACVLVAGLAVPGTMFASSVTVPNMFTAGTVARAGEVNANFAALTLEATRVSNIVNGPGDGTASNRVVDLAAPIASTDAVNRAYVDAAGSGGTDPLTLIGVTTCPAGWTVALTGQPFFTNAYFSGGGTTASPTPPTPTYVCVANPRTSTAAGGGTYLSITNSATAGVGVSGWWLNQDSTGAATCVICVK